MSHWVMASLQLAWQAGSLAHGFLPETAASGWAGSYHFD
jgi:hypothetical protein